MDEFSKLKASVLEQTELKGQEYYKRETNILEKKFNQQLDELKKSEEDTKLSRINKVKRAHESEIQQIANKERQMALVSKQKIMNELFDETLKTILSWSEEEELSFINQVLNKYKNQELTLKFGELTKNKLTDSSIEELLKLYPSLSLSEQVVPFEAGIILSDEKIDYNYLYSKMIQYIQSEIGNTLVSDIIAVDQ